MAKQNGPAHTIRIGYVKATIWYNKSGDTGFHTITITKAYKDSDGKWQDGHSFSHDDLPVVAKVADMACNWVSTQ